ncbi:hypothetical protein V6N12_029928 [Hibiscus sabdariffa]|uniref:Uncharacterized protein n=1 Tax=Hibiscus sabdariffa TaxID=183260 RepID=A0ABR2CXK8_9ROSI
MKVAYELLTFVGVAKQDFNTGTQPTEGGEGTNYMRNSLVFLLSSDLRRTTSVATANNMEVDLVKKLHNSCRKECFVLASQALAILNCNTIFIQLKTDGTRHECKTFHNGNVICQFVWVQRARNEVSGYEAQVSALQKGRGDKANSPGGEFALSPRPFCKAKT